MGRAPCPGEVVLQNEFCVEDASRGRRRIKVRMVDPEKELVRKRQEKKPSLGKLTVHRKIPAHLAGPLFGAVGQGFHFDEERGDAPFVVDDEVSGGSYDDGARRQGRDPIGMVRPLFAVDVSLSS